MKLNKKIFAGTFIIGAKFQASYFINQQLIVLMKK